MSGETEGRTLMNFQRLPDREKTLDREQVDTDVREACAKAEHRLTLMANRYTVNGWEVDKTFGSNGWEYGITDSTIVGRLRLKRAV